MPVQTVVEYIEPSRGVAPLDVVYSVEVCLDEPADRDTSVKVDVYVSKDYGASWQLYDRIYVPVEEGERCGSTYRNYTLSEPGEYWFKAVADSRESYPYVAVTVEEPAPPEVNVTKVELKADKTEVRPNEPVKFTVTAYLDKPCPSSRTVAGDIYVDGSKHYRHVYVDFREGQSFGTGEFTLTWSAEGTRQVKVWLPDRI